MKLPTVESEQLPIRPGETAGLPATSTSITNISGGFVGDPRKTGATIAIAMTLVALNGASAAAAVSYHVTGKSDNKATSATSNYRYFETVAPGCSGTEYWAILGPGSVTDNRPDDNYGGAIEAEWEYCDGVRWIPARQSVVKYQAGEKVNEFGTFTWGKEENRVPIWRYPVRNLHFFVCNVGPTGNVGTCGPQMTKVP